MIVITNLKNTIKSTSFKTLLLLVSIIFISFFIPNPLVFAQEEEEGSGANTFFCNTRYSRNIDENESARKTACQSGYDGKGCADASDSNGIKDACLAGEKAEKPIPEEPDLEEVKANSEKIEPPKYSYDSISGKSKCGSVDTAYISCPNISSGNISGSPIWGLLTVILNIAIVLVGIVAIGSMVYTGIIYASASDDPARVNQALTMLRNIMIGVVLFAIMYVFLQYIIPGGIFEDVSNNTP